MRNILFIIFVIELVGVIVLGLYFFCYYLSWIDVFLYGFFVFVSVIINVGFDIIGFLFILYVYDYFV